MTPQQRKTRQNIATLVTAVVDEMRNAPVITPRLLTVKDAGIYLSRSVRSIQSLIQIGTLPVVHIDSRTFLDVRDLDNIIEGAKV